MKKIITTSCAIALIFLSGCTKHPKENQAETKSETQPTNISKQKPTQNQPTQIAAELENNKSNASVSADSWSGKLELSKIATIYEKSPSPLPPKKPMERIFLEPPHIEEPRPATPPSQYASSNSQSRESGSNTQSDWAKQQINIYCDPSRFKDTSMNQSLGSLTSAIAENKKLQAQCKAAQQLK